MPTYSVYLDSWLKRKTFTPCHIWSTDQLNSIPEQPTCYQFVSTLRIRDLAKPQPKFDHIHRRPAH